MKKNRLYLPTIADLVDVLSIDQIKAIKIKNHKKSYLGEIVRICHDINVIIDDKKKLKLNARLIRIFMIIALINLFIWNLKDEMKEKPDKYNRLLKLAHQLNGIRNRMKNLLLGEFNDDEPSLKRTNTDTDNLKYWDIDI